MSSPSPFPLSTSAFSQEVWFAIPSANPDNCRRILPIWRKQGYKIAILQNRTRADIPADITVWSDSYPGWAESINILCRDIVPKSAPIVVSGGDDMLPDPQHTAQELAGQFLAHFSDTFGVMQPMGDGYLGAAKFCGSPWLGRGWIERAYGGHGPMPGEYKHNWADNELYWVARGLGALWERPDLSQEHRHFSRVGEDRPAYWTEAVERHDEDDVKLFMARLWQYFPGCDPLAGPQGTPAFDSDLLRREYKQTAEAYWIARYGEKLVRGESEARLRDALADCAARGERRIAIFGAGTHTRRAVNALAEPPNHTEIVCFIDDHAERRTQNESPRKLWGFPILSVVEALDQRLDAVVLSSSTMEAALIRSAEPLRTGGVRIVPLYTAPQIPPKADKPALAADR
jgi:hypothetical protein